MRPLGASLPAALLIAGVAASALAADAPVSPKAVLPFTEDDYPAAMKQARAKKQPVFIEAWAPW